MNQVLKGHDFSRALTADQRTGALAPEASFSTGPLTDWRRTFPCPIHSPFSGEWVGSHQSRKCELMQSEN
jgi:hypothetical protein